MGSQPLNPRNTRRIARESGLDLVRVVAHGGTHWLSVVTRDHRHGRFLRAQLAHGRDGDNTRARPPAEAHLDRPHPLARLEWPEYPMHLASCARLFPPADCDLATHPADILRRGNG